MKLKISAPTVVLDKRAGNTPVCDRAMLTALDGVASEECFSDYLMDNDASLTKALFKKGISGGYLRFRFRSDLVQLWVETEYDLREPLSDAEIECLRNYTLGQWSDGIGENFCPSYAEQTGLFLAPDGACAIVEII